MSVYHSIRGPVQADAADDDGMIVIDINATEMVLSNAIHPASERESGQVIALQISTKCSLDSKNDSHSQTTRIARGRAEHHVNNLTAQQMKQVIAMKQSQKSHEKKNRQQMCRNAIERGNKVREVNGKGGRQKRSDMNHCKVISRANNNRKC